MQRAIAAMATTPRWMMTRTSLARPSMIRSLHASPWMRADAKPASEQPKAAAEEPAAGEAEMSEEDKAAAVVAELEREKEELAGEAAKWKEEMLRAMADAENTRKRAQREIEVAKKYGVQGFAKTMLDVSDNLARSLEAVTEDQLGEDGHFRGFFDGVGMTNKILQGSFEKHGVVQFDPTGKEFDPNVMMALYEVPLTEGLEGGTVAQVVKTGYMLHDRVIRPAEVGVVKKA
eukprot:TRINITY_DN5769_c0_g1_i1.p1 TRINITY_DN5769_c0_g1~~TRINITY_DN5769_c0_g1_i1.p1  ORF type:complete len:232 (+),score=78.79 TRINITY_DN5769_c0_g1_i1:206-901(+)